MVGSINSGFLGCELISIGFSSGSPISTYTDDFDGTQDEVMLVNVTDFDPVGNCDANPYQVELRFTKVQ